MNTPEHSMLINETQRQRYEASWNAGEPLPLSDCLPETNSSEFLATLEELVHIQLEFAWKAHAAGTAQRPVSVDSLVEDFPSLKASEVLLRILRQEFHSRQQAGDQPSAADYATAYPDIDLDQLTTPPGETVGPTASDDTAIRAPVELASQATIPPPSSGTNLHDDQTLQAAISIAEPRDDQTAPSMAPGDNPEIQLEGYEILGELGRGGMGVVYRAMDLRLKRVVALKMVLAGAHADTAELQRFQLEAEAVAQLQHPNIVQIHDVGEHNGRPFLSLEFVGGGELASKIAGEPQPPAEAAELVETLSRAMHFAHQRNIIHRDLKPANVLLADDGQPKITDFGLAKRLEEDSAQTASGSIMGTPSYMAPEQAGGKHSTIGPQTDVYALGALLYCLLTGRPPFQSASVMDTVLQVLEQEPVPPRQLVQGLDRDLETITLKCLQKDPGRRYQSAEEVAEELRRFLGGEPIQARPVGAIERGWRWGRRKPAIAGLCAAISLLLVVGSSAFWEQQQAAFANGAVNTLLQSDTSQFGLLMGQLQGYHRWAQPHLVETFETSAGDSKAKLHSAMALLDENAEARKYLIRRLLDISPHQFQAVRDALAEHVAEDEITRFWKLAGDPQEDAPIRFQAACALASFDPTNPAWQESELGRFLAEHLVNVAPSTLLPWRETLRPARQHLHDPLAAVFRSDTADKQQRLFAADLLGEYLSDDPVALFHLLADSPAAHFEEFYNRLKMFGEQANKLAKAEVARVPGETASEKDRERLADRQVNSVAVLLRLEAADSIWPVFRHSEDPRLRSLLVHRMAPLGVESSSIIARLNDEQDTSARRALVLCLGEYDDTKISKTQRDALTEVLLTIYRDDPDPGMHSAAEWLLRRWQQAEALVAIDNELKQAAGLIAVDADRSPQWFINGEGQTLAIVDAGEFQMGSPNPPDQFKESERFHRRRIGRRFAIATKEITRGQWAAFVAETKELPNDFAQLAHVATTDDSPIVAVNWFGAAHYCNWLSKREGILEDQWCYKTNSQKQFGPGIQAKERFWELTGYRLPTEAEWEFACRAGTTTEYFFGQTDRLLTHYAWNRVNSGRRTRPVASLKPNDLGLFDILGNVNEWCYDLDKPYAISTATLDDSPGVDPVNNSRFRIVRGGAFDSLPASCRSAFRGDLAPRNYTLIMGFRLVRTMPSKTTVSKPKGTSIAGMTRSEAVTYLENLLKQKPEDEQIQSMLALSAHKLASQLAGQKQEEEALKRFQQAAELYRALGPTNLEGAEGLFNMANDWTTALASKLKHKQVVEVYTEALAAGELQQKNDPQDVNRLANMGVMHRMLGVFSFKYGRVDTTEEALKKSLAILEELADQQPQDAELRYKLSQTQNLTALFYRDTNRLKDGLVHQQATVASFQELTRLEPKNSRRYVDLAVQTLLLAEMWEHLPDKTKAEAAFRSAEDLFSKLGKVIAGKFIGNRIAISRLRIAELCLLRGAHADAVKMAVGVGQVPASHDPWGQRYSAARMLALAIAVAFKDPKLTPEQRVQLADKYSLAAMMMIKQLQGRKFFETPKNVKKFLDDPAFKTIENREDFKTLIQSLDKPKPDEKKTPRDTDKVSPDQQASSGCRLRQGFTLRARLAQATS